jgi:tetratricopeptide (TPR) repeat protein
MNRIGFLGLTLLLITALAMPGFGQAAPAQAKQPQAKQPQAKTTAEYNAYNALYMEKDPKKKAELGEKFIVDFKDSDFIAPAHRMIIGGYRDSQNWQKVLESADRAAGLSIADASLKGFAYGTAMQAAQQMNNFEKIVEYGEKVLGIEPNDPNALLTLSSLIPERLPTDEAAKNAALDKAAGYANRANTVIQKLAGQIKPEQKAEIEAQIHSTLGFIALNKQDYPTSVSEYETALKTAPKDAVAHFRLGLAYQYLAAAASKATVEAINLENEAKTARKPQPELDELAAKRQFIQDDFTVKRDRAIEELAAAVAIGGVVAQPARQALEALWKPKNNDTLDGLDAYIASKKP